MPWPLEAMICAACGTADEAAVVGGGEEGALVLAEDAGRRIAEEGLVLADRRARIGAEDAVGNAGGEAEVVERGLDLAVLLTLVGVAPAPARAG